MTKQEFLTALATALAAIPERERNDIVRDYAEYFSDAQIAGRSDAEVVATLGHPAQIAKQLIADYHLRHAQNHLTVATFFKATLAVISLAFFNLVFVLGPLIGVESIWEEGYAQAATQSPTTRDCVRHAQDEGHISHSEE